MILVTDYSPGLLESIEKVSAVRWSAGTAPDIIHKYLTLSDKGVLRHTSFNAGDTSILVGSDEFLRHCVRLCPKDFSMPTVKESVDAMLLLLTPEQKTRLAEKLAVPFFEILKELEASREV